MQIFQCDNCQQVVFFENTTCERCGSCLGYRSDRNAFNALVQESGDWRVVDHAGRTFRYCGNHTHAVCNWLVPSDGDSLLCTACKLNGIVPDSSDPQQVNAWRLVEDAKHRLVYSLIRFNLPLENKVEAPDSGLVFDFRSDDLAPSDPAGVKTGHWDGTITINLAEADAVERERTRERLSEPYRTLIGHFRHEIGHYYWQRLVIPRSDVLQAFRRLFGDERTDYSESMGRYYDHGPPNNWREFHVTAYSAAHPWEDWAETWAHYLHIVDTLETAFAFGIRLGRGLHHLEHIEMKADFDPYLATDFNAIVAASIPLTIAINSLNRSMGQPDLYPFTLAPPVMDKLHFVHQLLTSFRTAQIRGV
jgi:hypothetical protein